MRPRSLGIVAAALAAGCGAYGNNSTGGPSPIDGGPLPPNVMEVDASDGLVFAPVHLTVTAGTTVRWVNKGRYEHTVTSGASSKDKDSPGAAFDAELSIGGLYEHTFTEAGDQPYFCRFHEAMGMAGVVTVSP
jgi:plastocyanin